MSILRHSFVSKQMHEEDWEQWFRAVKADEVDVLKLMLSEQKVDTNYKDAYGRNTLQLAQIYGSSKLEQLLSEYVHIILCTQVPSHRKQTILMVLKSHNFKI